MKQLYSLLVFLISMTFSTAIAQVYVNSFPWTEDFEGLNNCSGSCAASCPNIGDFTQAGIRNWIVDNGGTGSGGTGPSVDHNPGNSAGKYIYSEASFPCYSGSNNWIAESPYFDFTNTNGGYELTFWWHMYGQTMGDAHLDVRIGAGGAWTLNVIPSWTSNADEWVEEVVNLTSYAGSDSVQFRIRHENPSNFYADMALDDFSMVLLLPNDAGVTQILSPQNPFCGSDTQMVVEITNFGVNNLTSAIIDFTVGGSAGTPINWTGNLTTGQTDTLTISTSAITPGTTIDASTSMPNNVVDLAPSNDESAATFYAGLSGTYDIPGDMGSFEIAVDSMIAIGICDTVIFDVAPGTYTEQIVIPEIFGAGMNSPVIFRGDAVDTSLLTFASVSSAANYTLLLDDADWIFIEDMHISSTAPTYSRVVEYRNGANLNRMTDCVVIGKESTTSTSTLYATLYANGAVNDNNSFVGCEFLNGSYSVYWRGTNTTTLNESTVFDDCDFLDHYYMGAYLYYNNNLELLNSRFRTNSPYTGTLYHVYNYYSDGAQQIVGNRVERDSTAYNRYGMFLGNCDATAAGRGLIANNSVVIGDSVNNYTRYGMYFTNCSFQDIYHNSIAKYGGSTNSRTLFINGGGALNVANNNIVNFGSGWGYYLNPTYVVLTSENNNIISNDGIFGYANGTNQNSLAEWQANVGFDLNSVSVDPTFVDPWNSDLHICNDTLNKAGKDLLGLVLTDFDDQSRDQSAPDIGADEFGGASDYAFPADTMVICDGESVVLNGAADGSVNLWSNSTTGTSITVTTAGTWALTVTNSCGSFSDQVETVLSDLEAQATLDKLITCNGDTDGKLNAAVTGGVVPLSYMWSNSGVSPQISNLAPGTYSVTVTDGSGCTSVSEATLADPAIIVSTITVDSNVSCGGVANGAATITATGGSLPYTYLWSNGTTTASNAGLAVGSYSVLLTDAGGCNSSVAVSIVKDQCLGIESLLEEVQANYYPNPTSGLVNMELSGLQGENITIEVLNSRGQIIFTEDASNLVETFKNQLDLSSQAQGIYLINVRSDNFNLLNRVTLQ